jgi:beta-phosphoglucomutase-like phosphatase (HAD superfamily)
LELADLTKYVLSLWEHNGFTLEGVLYWVMQKSQMIEEQYQMDFNPIPSGWPVVIVDVDGTLGDFRKAFGDYLLDAHQIQLGEDASDSLLFDADNSMAYPTYYPLKEAFEAEGGYGWLPPYYDAIHLLQDLKQEMDLALVVYTARPASRYKHIWLDTIKWLWGYNLRPMQLHIGGAERLLLADTLIAEGHRVVMFEDDPSIIRRASATGIPVVGRLHSYNRLLGDLPGVELVTDYLQFPAMIRDLLTGESSENS